jgi:hypothetical protein
VTCDPRREEARPRAEDRREALAAYTADIAARLRPVCAHLSEADFQQLVRDIARMRARLDEIELRPDAGRPLRDQSGDLS